MCYWLDMCYLAVCIIGLVCVICLMCVTGLVCVICVVYEVLHVYYLRDLCLPHILPVSATRPGPCRSPSPLLDAQPAAEYSSP